MPSSEYMKIYYKKNPEKYKEQLRRCLKNHENIRLEILALLGNKCVRCGFSDPRALQVDHINGNGNKQIEKFTTCSYYRFVLNQLKAGSKDYQLLCANCNWIKRCENNECHRQN